LKKFGAAQLKTSAYILPDHPAQYEHFQWLAEEIRSAAGEATLIRVAEIEGMENREIVNLFNEARSSDYKELVNQCRKALKSKSARAGEELRTQLEPLQRRFAEISAVDYFKSPEASEAQLALRQLERMLEGPKQSKPAATAAPRLNPAQFKGKTWLTRPRPGIDRAGSAWLIRKFIDPRAKFLFGGEASARPKALPFDMADVEFSHHGDDCSFETLVKRFAIADKAVLKIAEMVHDADLEDGKFQRPECIGINAVLSGWEKTGISDGELLEKGIGCFEGLYLQLRK